MASKPYNSPLIIFKGFDKLSDILSIFPFDVVYKHMLVNNIKIVSNGVPTIPQMIDLIWSQLFSRRLQEKHLNGDYAYEEFGGFRLTTSNKQFELSYELI